MQQAMRRVPKRLASTLLTAAVVLLGVGGLGPNAQAQDESTTDVIRRVDIVHMTHTDIGFTDHPLVSTLR